MKEPEPKTEPGVFGLEPEPLGKKIMCRSRSRLERKSGAEAGVAKKMASSSALNE